jgi:hypothetical protein
MGRPSDPTPRKKILTCVPLDLLEELERQAEEQKRARSALINDALRAYLDTCVVADFSEARHGS